VERGSTVGTKGAADAAFNGRFRDDDIEDFQHEGGSRVLSVAAGVRLAVVHLADVRWAMGDCTAHSAPRHLTEGFGMTETELRAGERVAQIYRQVPGADIDPGWWIVLHPPWWDAGVRPRWLGPCHYKRDALKAARVALVRGGAS
jgi:hypothetical protein